MEEVRGILVCIRGKNLLFYQVQDVMNTFKRTFRGAEIVLGVSETLADVEPRMAVSFV